VVSPDRFTISSADVHDDYGLALIGLTSAAVALGVKVDCRLQSVWLIYLPPCERSAFLALAREAAHS
jgi:hypothetical protein